LDEGCGGKANVFFERMSMWEQGKCHRMRTLEGSRITEKKATLNEKGRRVWEGYENEPHPMKK